MQDSLGLFEEWAEHQQMSTNYENHHLRNSEDDKDNFCFET